MARKAANGFEAIADMSRAPAAFCRYSIPPESWPSTNSLAVGTSHSDRARVLKGQNVFNPAFRATGTPNPNITLTSLADGTPYWNLC